MSEPVVYRHVIEAFLMRVVHSRQLFTLAELRTRGLEPPRDAPIETYVKFVREAAARAHPDVSEHEALERVGRETIQGYVKGIVGQGIAIVMRLLGPRRGLLRMAENYRTTDNVTEVVATALGPSHVRLEFNRTYGIPEFQKGILSEVMNVLNQKEHVVTFALAEGDGAVFEVTW